MSDEIKRILKEIEFFDENYVLDTKDSKLLLNYITNLQQQLHQASLDIQELTERDIECPSWCDKLTNLQQENKRLRQQNFNLIECRDSLIDENREQREDLFDYKSKVEKAVEYIKEHSDKLKTIRVPKIDFNYNELLTILQGEKDE